MSKKVMYLHGLGSSALGSTCIALEKKGVDLLAENYRPQFFNESIDKLKELIEKENPDYIVGTSMGGYYAAKMYEIFKKPTLIINPSYNPRELLKKYTDGSTQAYDYLNNCKINFTEDMINEFENINIPSNDKIYMIIGENDDLICPTGQRRFANVENINYSITEWGHRVENVDVLLDILKEKLGY